MPSDGGVSEFRRADQTIEAEHTPDIVRNAVCAINEAGVTPVHQSFRLDLLLVHERSVAQRGRLTVDLPADATDSPK